jgi:hypothetical protein
MSPLTPSPATLRGCSRRRCRDQSTIGYCGYWRCSGGAQTVEAERQHGAEPNSVICVVGIGIPRLRMQKHGQAVAVEHQPRQKRCQQFRGKCDLVHRFGMRPNQLIVPAPDDCRRKLCRDTLSQRRGTRPGRPRAIIDVRVIAPDIRRIDRLSCDRRHNVLAHYTPLEDYACNAAHPAVASLMAAIRPQPERRRRTETPTCCAT